MRTNAVAAAALLAALAGCASPDEAPPTVQVLEMAVATERGTSFHLGDVLGSAEGEVVEPYRFDDGNKTLVADLPEGARHVLLVRQEGVRPTVMTNATRAAAEREGAAPAVVEFKPRAGRFDVTVVQPDVCAATVNHAGEVDNGTGTFELDLPAGDWAVLVLPGEEAACARLRLELRNLGAWTVVRPNGED